MPILVATALKKSFGPLHVLDGVHLSIEQGERVGLVGINGSGKSTLARILAGVDVADSGSLASPRDTKVAYLPQNVLLPDSLSVRQIVLQGLGAWDEACRRHESLSDALTELVERQAAAAADVERHGGWNQAHRVESILGHIGLKHLEAPVETLSGGDRRRVALAQLLVSAPHLAILDEPSNHLDVSTITWLEKYLVETYQGALLMITHDRTLLDRVVTRTLEIENGRLHSYPGGYESFLEAKSERLLLEARTEANRQNFLRRELEWLRRQPKARTGKQKARIQRVEEAVATRALPTERTVKLAIDSIRSGKTILELHDLALEIGEKTLASGLTWWMTAGDRVGIIGPNGVGKTTLLRCILGQMAPSAGKVVMGKNTQIAYFDQHRSDLDENESVFENVAGPRSHVDLAGRRVDVHAYLERFLFSGPQIRQPVRGLSGGERARVALAKLLSHGANLLILDEPTNDLDVATLGALEELLLEFDGCVIVVTHDRWFLNRVATTILSFESDAKVVPYAGNYDAYCLQRQRQQADEKDRSAISKAPPPIVSRPKKGLTYAEQIELEGLFDRITLAEEKVEALEKQLADPALYSTRREEIPQLHVQLSQAKEQVGALTSRWEELELKRETTVDPKS